MLKDSLKIPSASDVPVQISLIADALPVLLAYVDCDERYRFVNRAYVGWFGFSPDCILGHTVRDVIGDTAYQVLRPHIRKALAGERVDYEAKVPFQTGLQFIHAQYMPDRDPSGRVLGYVALIENVSERKEPETAYRELAEKLELRVRERTDEILEKSKRLERFNRITIDREHDMIRLKKEINALLERLGEPRKYLTPPPAREFLGHAT